MIAKRASDKEEVMPVIHVSRRKANQTPSLPEKVNISASVVINQYQPITHSGILAFQLISESRVPILRFIKILLNWKLTLRHWYLVHFILLGRTGITTNLTSGFKLSGVKLLQNYWHFVTENVSRIFLKSQEALL